jgi:hypothetical protein
MEPVPHADVPVADDHPNDADHHNDEPNDDNDNDYDDNHDVVQPSRPAA